MRRLGIDVSEHNGILDWDAIKKGGIEFAIIRSSWGHFEEDKQFRRNVRECERVKNCPMDSIIIPMLPMMHR